MSAGFVNHETGPLMIVDDDDDDADADEPLSALGSTHIHLYSETGGGRGARMASDTRQ